MIQGIDNRMLFGALNNLRLAPHVREGREAALASRPGAVGPNAPVEAAGMGPAQPVNSQASSATPAAGPSAEKLSISAEALRALEQFEGAGQALEPRESRISHDPRASDHEPRADEPARPQVAMSEPSVEGAAQNAIAAQAAQAYGQQAAADPGSRAAIPLHGLLA